MSSNQAHLLVICVGAFMLTISTLFGISIFSAQAEKEKACVRAGYSWIDGKCLDVTVIEIDA